MTDVPKLRTARRFYYECKRIGDVGGPYRYGGGHGVPLSQVRVQDGIDCSAAIYLALHRAGFPVGGYAGNSTTLMNLGKPGKGKWFTIYANPQHTFAVFGIKGFGVRFDTSPWGSGGLGPRIRWLPRPTTKFVARHIPGW